MVYVAKYSQVEQRTYGVAILCFATCIIHFSAWPFKSNQDNILEAISLTTLTYAAVTKRLGGREVNRLGALAVAEDADKTYGTLLKKLEDLGIAKNTYVIYTTDHGTPGRNPPLSGGKGTIGEGGLRVPMLVRGPGVAAGSFARQWTSGLDIFPTIADLAAQSGGAAS